MMKLPIVNVVAAILVDGHKVLATQRGYGEMKDGWEFPGGKIEAGEAPEEALVREIREELNVAIAVERLLCTVEHHYAAFHLSMRCYVCRITDGQPELLEHEAARWLTAEELWSVDWLPADVKIIDKVEGLLRSES